MDDNGNNTEASWDSPLDKITHRAKAAITDKIEGVVDRAIATPEIEAVVRQAIERVLFTLVRRYWFPAVVLSLIVTAIQALILGFLLKGYATAVQ